MSDAPAAASTEGQADPVDPTVAEVSAAPAATPPASPNQPPRPAYHDRYNPDLLKLLPGDARSLLEVGCGSGLLALAYHQHNPTAIYSGIEQEAAAATTARPRLTGQLFLENAEDPAAIARISQDIPPGSLDCLIYGDVLEHFVDPWKTLATHAQWLTPGGSVVACIPNIQHWSILRSLIRGQWHYDDEGLLDRTHLRFFTHDSIHDLFAQAGLQIYDIQPRCFGNRYFEAFWEKAKPLVEALQVDEQVFRDRAQVVQYIVRAARPEVQPFRKLFVQTIVLEQRACKRSRVTEPNDFLNRLPGVRTLACDRTAVLGQEQPGEETVFVWQRALLHSDQDLKSQRNLLSRGYLIVAEVDDDPFRWYDLERDDFFAYRSCHCVQTSTPALAEYLRQLNPYVAVFANQIATLPPPRTYDPAAPTTIFFGALNREQDWQPIMPVLNRVLAARGDRVRVIVLHDRQFFNAIQTPHKTFTPFTPFEDYQAALRQSDVALLPLLPTRFNGMKSDLKFIECAANGVVVLASPTVYANSIMDGQTGLLYQTPADFEHRLTALLDHPDLRHTLAQQAYRWVGTQRMQAYYYRDRYDWYCQMRDRLPELNDSLRRRIPELFA